MHPWEFRQGGWRGSRKQIEARVLKYYNALYPGSNKIHKLSDKGRTKLQVEDDGEELAIDLNCDPERTELYACKSVGAMIDLLVRTRRSTKGVMFKSAQIGLRASRILYPKR